jgi:hypothetical protein
MQLELASSFELVSIFFPIKQHTVMLTEQQIRFSVSKLNAIQNVY